MEMRPFSSETRMARQSVSSVMPMAARCRVPNLVDSAGFILSGRKQAAVLIRSFCTITAPSCSAPSFRKILKSRSLDICASRRTPLSMNVRRPMSRSITIRAPVFSMESLFKASRISSVDSRRRNALPNSRLRPIRASVRRISD